MSATVVLFFTPMRSSASASVPTVGLEYQLMTDTTLTPTRLWKNMTATQRLAAARAFWLEESATDDQLQAVMLIAQQKKFRPKSVIALDVDRKAKQLAS